MHITCHNTNLIWAKEDFVCTLFLLPYHTTIAQRSMWLLNFRTIHIYIYARINMQPKNRKTKKNFVYAAVRQCILIK